MTNYYADSSALAKRHVREVGTDWFRALAAPQTGNAITTARISQVEIYSSLNRKLRETVLTIDQYAEVIADFAAFCLTQYEFLELTSTIIERSRFLLERHPLRAYDAVQLASALVMRETLQANRLPAPIFLSADDRLLKAAEAEGLAIDNPNLHP